MPLKIAIVGRPNVGKSTLFNRLAGKQLALVDNQPGVTRDRKEAPGRLADLPLILIDTAGFEDVHDDSLESRMRHQTEVAIREAELALFLIDARDGVTPTDESFAEVLRKADIPVVLAANKAEGNRGDIGIAEAWGLGFGEPVGLSGAHGEGMGELYGAIRAALGEEAFEAAFVEEDAAEGEGFNDENLDQLAEHIHKLEEEEAAFEKTEARFEPLERPSEGVALHANLLCPWHGVGGNEGLHYKILLRLNLQRLGPRQNVS